MRSKVLKPIGIFLLILALLAAILFFLVQTRYFREFVRVTANSVIDALTDQEFYIGSIEGNFLRGVMLKDVTFKIDGQDFLDIDEIFIDYSLPLMLDSSTLFSKLIPIDRLTAKGLRLNLIYYPDKTWNYEVLEPFKLQEWRDPTDWNIFIENAKGSDVRIFVNDRIKNEVLEYELNNLDFSLKVLKLIENIEVELDNGDLIARYHDQENFEINLNEISGKATYSINENLDKVDIKHLSFLLGQADVSLEGTISKFENPRFNLKASAAGIDLGEAGTLNLEIKARGLYKDYEEIDATAELKLVDSLLMDTKIGGGVDSIVIKGNNLDFTEGTLKTGFGQATLQGNLYLEEIMEGTGNNSLDINIALDSLQTAEVMKLFQQSEELAVEEIDERYIADVNSDITVKGSWSESEPFSALFDFKDLNIVSGSVGEINLVGPLKLADSKLDYDFDIKFLNANLAPVLEDDIYESDLNSSFKLKGVLGLEGEFPDNFEGSVKAQFEPSSIFDMSLEGGQIDASFANNVLTLRSLVLDSDKIDVNADGTFGSSRTRGINYDIDFKDLSVVSTFARDIQLKGSLNAKGKLSGDIDTPKLSLTATGLDFSYDNDTVKIRRFDFSGDTNFDFSDLKISAAGTLRDTFFNGREIETVKFNTQSAAGGVDGNLSVFETNARKYSMDFKLRDLMEEETSLEIDNININIEKSVLTNKEPVDVKIFRDRLTLRSFNLHHKDNYIVGDADVGFDNTLQAKIELKKIDLLDVSELFNFQFPVKGQVSGVINFGPSLNFPDIDAGILASNVEYMNFKSDRITLDVLFSKGDVDLGFHIYDNSKSILSATAQAKVDLTQEDFEKSFQNTTFNANIKSDGIDLSPLIAFNEELTTIDGKLIIDLTASGSGMDPNVNGKIEVKDVSFNMYSLANKVRIPEAVFEMSGKQGKLHPLTIKTEEGEGTFEGSVDFRTLKYTAKGVLAGLMVRTTPTEATAKIDGWIDVKGEMLNALITGDITARDIEVIVPEKPVKLVENIKFVNQREAEREEFIYTGKGEIDNFIEYVEMKLNIDIPKDSWVKGSGANIEVEGKIEINKNLKEPYIVTGNIDVVRGEYQFMGKLFVIQGGTVSFRGKEIINPFIDVRALYEISRIEVYINITGTAEKPKIKLSSNPPLEENEIVSYLVFGTSSDTLGTDDRVAFQEKAGEFLGAMAVDEIRDMFGDQFAVDILTIKGGQTGFGETGIEVGKYVTEDLYVGYERYSYERFFYQRYFFSPGVQSSIITANRAVIEYRIFDFLTVESKIGDETGADLFFNFDY
jgi:autotransporter translocation and assembly factor TamB